MVSLLFRVFAIKINGMGERVVCVLCLAVAMICQAQTTPEEKQLFEQLNRFRRQAGLEALQWDERLAQAAREHSQRMAQANQLGHALPGELQVAERLAATGIRFNRSGENVGCNSDFDDIHSEWMHSPPHRENILRPDYNVVGLGIARSDDGVYWATQDFAHAVVQRTNAQAEDAVAHSFQTLRAKSGRTPVQRLVDPKLHGLACDMAKTGKLEARLVSGLPDVRQAVVYNNSRPENLPRSAQLLSRSSAVTRVAVGACFTAEPNNPGGTFYVVMAFY